MSTSEIICDPVFTSRRYPEADEIICFVIMPFSVPLLQDVYANTIKPTVESFGVKCMRGDDIFSVGSIIEDVWTAICRSHFILGEFTGRNPNVLYEAGVAHTLGKPLILLTQDIHDVPFDFRHLRHIVYENSPSGYRALAERLNKTIETLLKEPLPNLPRLYEPPGEEIARLKAELVDMHNRQAGLLTGIEERILFQHEYYHKVISRLKGPLGTSERDAYLESIPFCKVEGGKVNVDLLDEGSDEIITLGKETVKSFYITKFPITNLQYKFFLEATGHPPPETWVDGEIPSGLENHPVLGSSWVGVQSFCRWFSEIIGNDIDIPSEAEWLLAAGYRPDHRYPWGNTWKPQSCNSKEAGIGRPTPVDLFEGKGDSPFGCVDMLGNVWEWTRSLHNYSGGFDFKWRAVRGGANYNALRNVGSLARLWANPGHFLFVRDLGFRVIYYAE